MAPGRSGYTDLHGRSPRCGPCQSVYVANAALTLLNLTTYLLKQQIERQAADFEKDGGFTEHLYKTRKKSTRR